MALIELGLTEDEFYCTPPRHTFLMQLHNRRNLDRQWEQTRFVAAMVHNTSMGKKRNIMPKRLVPLSIDEKGKDYPDWTKEEADELIQKWGIN